MTGRPTGAQGARGAARDRRPATGRGAAAASRTAADDSRAARSAAARKQSDLDPRVRPIVTAAGFDLEAISVSQAGRRSVVRVVVDSDNGVSLDDIASLSRSISAELDGTDDGLGSSPYTLEVTSPGVDRPLTEQRHWQRATGRLVEYQVDGKRVQARVVDVSGDDVRLERDGSRFSERWAAISPARVQVEFAKPTNAKE